MEKPGIIPRLFFRHLGDYRADECAIFIECNEVGWLSHSDITGVEASHCGGVGGQQRQGFLEGGAGEFEEIGERLIESEDAAGENAIGCGAAVGDLDSEFTEHVGAVRHTGCRHAVRDKDRAGGTFGAKPKRDERWVDVDAVADELCVKAVCCEDSTKDAGFAMIEGSHGVECVCGRDSSGGDSGQSLGVSRIGVPDRDADTAGGGVRGEFGGVGKLGSKREETNVSFGGFVETIKQGYLWREQVFGGMNSALGVRDKGAFKVDAERFSAGPIFRASNEVCQAAQSAQCGVDWSCHGGCEETARTAGGQETAHGVERFRGSFHYVVTGGAMDVDVEESWGQRGRG